MMSQLVAIFLLLWHCFFRYHGFILRYFPAYSPYCNLALKKLTYQNSTTFEGISSRAVDGNRNTNYHGGNSCIHTDDNYPFWIVDLGRVFQINLVRITNRGDARTYIVICIMMKLILLCNKQANISRSTNDFLLNASCQGMPDNTQSN